MEYKKKLYLKNLIFSKNDLKKITAIVFNKVDNTDSKIDIKFSFDDDSEILSHDLTIFDSDYLDEKNINKFEIDFFDTKNFKESINISIDTYKHSNSYISVKSEKEEWYLSVLKSFEEKILCIKKQNIMSVFFNNYISSIFTPTITSFCIIFFLIIITDLEKTAFIYFIIILVMITTYISFDKIAKLYPLIDFEFGGGKNFKRNKIKKNISLIISFLIGNIIIPILINFFF